jgi:hypothetical protein
MLINQQMRINKWKQEFFTSRTYTTSGGQSVTVTLRKKPEVAELELV